MALSKILENSITDGVVSSAKLKDFAAAVDLNGVELILDADQDTSITADTDDRIDLNCKCRTLLIFKQLATRLYQWLMQRYYLSTV